MSNIIQNENTLFETSVFTNILGTVINEIDLYGSSSQIHSLFKVRLANSYAALLTQTVNRYNLTIEETEAKFNLKCARNYFACNNIDIDDILSNYVINYNTSEDIDSQLFNLKICSTEYIESMLLNENELGLADENDKILTTN